MDRSQAVTTVEWCAGYAGIGLGLKGVFGERLRCLAYSDVEGFVQANLISKMEEGLLDAAPLWPNLKTFPCADFHGLVDILVAGFPCQPFSHAGKRVGDEDPRHLFPYIKRAAEVMRPRFLFLENVEGLISAKLAGEGWNDSAGTPVLLHVIRELGRIGYKAAWGIFSASEVGAPHQRKRVFILAYDRLQRQAVNELKTTGAIKCGTENELAYDKNSKRELAGATRDGRSGLANGGSENELALRNGVGLPHGESEIKSAEARFHAQRDPAASGGEDVANHHHQGLQGVRERGGQTGREVADGHFGGDSQVWPSRPGERQYAWEPPRVVTGNVDDTKRGTLRNDYGKNAGQVNESKGADAARAQTDGQTQPPMGGNADGLANGLDFPRCTGLSDSELEEIHGWMVKGTNRTDELRLNGNGVVPSCATTAWNVLYGELFGK